MGSPAGLLVTAHLVGCALVAYMGVLAIALAEIRTPAGQADAERVGALLIAVLLLAVAWWISLVRGNVRFAVATLCLELVLGGIVLARGLDEPDRGDGWLYALAIGVALTGIGAVVAAHVHRAEQTRPAG
jgi:hypothetical protein